MSSFVFSLCLYVFQGGVCGGGRAVGGLTVWYRSKYWRDL